MLRVFRFANHRSFREEQELSLLPVYDRSQREAVPIAAVYGANAAGKSTVLDALRFMAAAVEHSYGGWDPIGPVPRTPFRLAARAAARPSRYLVDVVIDGVRYEYGFGLDDVGVVEEHLHTWPQRKKRVLFAREGERIRFGGGVPGIRTTLPRLVRPGALLLTTAAHAGVEPLLAVYHWFRRSVRILDLGAGAAPMPSADAYRQAIDGRSDRVERLVDLVRAADLGICAIELPAIGTHRATVIELASRGQDPISTVFRRILHEHPPVPVVADPTPQEIRLVHGEAALSPAEESAGTRDWLTLVWAALPVLEAGGVLVVDELDRRLHPLLSARLLGFFRDVGRNPHGGQLIFAAHDTSLLAEGLRRDDIWFVEKDADGASRLFPLTEFGPRQGENPERRYLSGSYGAIPAYPAVTERSAAASPDPTP